ncbi:hypothetical protein U9M48_005830 [Paspalum notatum var. saurae]|uniref:Uncharacterized protein n=1 Tax=Paspalum notatum var. saurae TaxID=547442 RepID=A0AAQ3SKA5_PASNO
MFSPNTSEQVRQHIIVELGIKQLTNNERYLGLPVYIGKSKKKMFEYIKQKVWNRIHGWQEKLLSKAGKEIMIKAVAQAIPTYAMSCFDLTKELCDEISSLIGRYWWSQRDKTNKIHWVLKAKYYADKSILEAYGSCRIITPRGGSLLQKVYDLINLISGSWDEELVRDTFWDEDSKIILAMPIFQDTEDYPAWHPDPKGLFQ